MNKRPYKTVDHVFGPSQTIRGAIRMCNRNEAMTEEELDLAMHYFNEENGYNVPHPGRPYKIPVFI